jgi:hypothetical protein
MGLWRKRYHEDPNVGWRTLERLGSDSQGMVDYGWANPLVGAQKPNEERKEMKRGKR